MTGAILQADIELARKLIGDGHGDEEVVAALCRRGVETGKAELVVADLRRGVRANREWGVIPPPGRRRRSRRTHRGRRRRWPLTGKQTVAALVVFGVLIGVLAYVFLRWAPAGQDQQRPKYRGPRPTLTGVVR